jgi:hypothetical protein
MEFAAVLAQVADFLDERNRRWALVGGVGLAALGYARSTVDLDFVVESAAQDELVGFLTALGYETLHRSSGYSNHQHADARLGRIDFVYVGADTADRLFPDCRRVAGPGGREVAVPRPEHLAAMKATAIGNDPSRRHRDLADVQFLLSLPGTDRAEVRSYFERQGLGRLFDELDAPT